MTGTRSRKKIFLSTIVIFQACILGDLFNVLFEYSESTL